MADVYSLHSFCSAKLLIHKTRSLSSVCTTWLFAAIYLLHLLAVDGLELDVTIEAVSSRFLYELGICNVGVLQDKSGIRGDETGEALGAIGVVAVFKVSIGSFSSCRWSSQALPGDEESSLLAKSHARLLLSADNTLVPACIVSATIMRRMQSSPQSSRCAYP